MKKGWQADYLMFTEDVTLPPAGKIGVVLLEEEKTKNQPSRVAILDIIPLGKADEAGLQKGDVILMPPDEKHQFKNLSDTEGARFMCLVPIAYQK